ncbi:hypothetical protein [Pseudomonas fitomaticsae]|uniref:Uncharacterized protein n=1 Tax=Pseudomonas fitomaticsae TaxID=2837969 RepID=A0ABY3Q170_9PSED|nr:hypothetical protein [Pseudomonas fitomaticsae]UFP99846.1 hypothetical protein KJY40_28205 [Pseudomonas fitomaticsae]
MEDKQLIIGVNKMDSVSDPIGAFADLKSYFDLTVYTVSGESFRGAKVSLVCTDSRTSDWVLTIDVPGVGARQFHECDVSAVTRHT